MVADRIRTFAAHHPDSPIIVTSRIAGYLPYLPGSLGAELPPSACCPSTTPKSAGSCRTGIRPSANRTRPRRFRKRSRITRPSDGSPPNRSFDRDCARPVPPGQAPPPAGTTLRPSRRDARRPVDELPARHAGVLEAGRDPARAAPRDRLAAPHRDQRPHCRARVAQPGGRNPADPRRADLGGRTAVPRLPVRAQRQRVQRRQPPRPAKPAREPGSGDSRSNRAWRNNSSLGLRTMPSAAVWMASTEATAARGSPAPEASASR